MNKLLLFTLMFLTLSGFAQQNVVKVGLSGVYYGNMSLGYERAISDNSSLNFNIGYWDMNTGIFDVDKYYFPNEDDVIFESFGKGFNTSIDYRFYIGQNQKTFGFYMAPYLRYWNKAFYLSDIIPVSQMNNQRILFDIEAKASSIGLGFQLGYHWLIYDKISIDWYFLGIGLEKMNLNGKYNAPRHETFNYAYIEDDIWKTFEDVKFLHNKLSTEVTPDNLLLKLPLWLPGIKTGFTIGYAF